MNRKTAFMMNLSYTYGMISWAALQGRLPGFKKGRKKSSMAVTLTITITIAICLLCNVAYLAFDKVGELLGAVPYMA